MPGEETVGTSRSAPIVFLSYASEDREAARLIKDALPDFGIEVWYDESELGGGEAWDQKIRRQIRDCDYFMALVSAQTEARHEGYFRREWRLAVERTLDMADDHAFLLPIAIDETVETGARVPEKFLTVQWLRVPGGKPTPALEALCRRIASGEATSPGAARGAVPARPRAAGSPAPQAYPEFPREEPGQKMRFWAHVIGWAARSAWIFFKGLPRWVRIIAWVWLASVLLSRGCASRHHDTEDVSPTVAKKLKTITDNYQGSSKPADVAKLGAQIAHEVTGDVDAPPPKNEFLAIPFVAVDGDEAAAKLANSTFTLVYGRLVVSRRHVGLSPGTPGFTSLDAALQRARSQHATYILYGTVDSQAENGITIKILTVEDGDVEWSKSYRIAGADPAKIAADVMRHVPEPDDD